LDSPKIWTGEVGTESYQVPNRTTSLSLNTTLLLTTSPPLHLGTSLFVILFLLKEMPKDKPSDKGRSFFFTYNNYPSVQHVKERLHAFGDTLVYYVIQEEIGAEGTPHIQGIYGLNAQKSISACVKLLKDNHFSLRIPDCIYACIVYCQKEDTRKAGTTPTIYGTLPVKSRKPVARPQDRVLSAERLRIIPREKLYLWQSRIVAIAEHECDDDRTVYWFWEPVGSCGKSVLCKYLVFHHAALYVAGGYKDIMCALKLYSDTHEGVYPTILILDIPRDSLNYISYQAIEAVKNGLGFAGKYESGGLIFPSMHVFCFANEPPKMEHLSADRWHIEYINPQGMDMHVIPAGHVLFVPETPSSPPPIMFDPDVLFE